jgi:apolipoprotein N-acyltransferase
VATVGLRRGATLYERWGDLPVEIAAVLLLLSAAWPSRRRPRAKGAPPVA